MLLLILTMCGVSSALAQRFSPTFAASEAEAVTWHYIIFPNNGNDKIYANANNGKLNWASASVTSTDDFKWYLIGTSDNFILKSVSGKYVYTTQTGTGRETAYTITDDASLATSFNLVNGNNSNTWAIHRVGGDTGNNFNHRNGNEIKEWTIDNGSSVIFSNPNELIKYSDAPSNGAWAANTNWFTMRNNRNNQSGHNRKYITTSAAGVDENISVLPILAEMPNDRGSYWCFVGNASGFVIQNAAYGPDFVLAISGNQSNATVQMFRKGEVPNGYTYNFTAVDNSVIDDGSFAYAFRLGTTGNIHIHVTQGRFIVYNHSAISGGDTGSAFKLTYTDNSVVNALTSYDVYKVQWRGAADDFTITYADASKTFGKRGKSNQDSYLIIESGSAVDKNQFTISNSSYVIDEVEVIPVADYFYKDLVLSLRDKEATDPWSIRIIQGDADESIYTVTYKGMSLGHGSIFYTHPNVVPQSIYFTINDVENKFVWGPVINKAAKTITFDVRDRVTTLTDGWYEMQILPDNLAQIVSKIKPEEGNINTSANYLYVAPSVYDVDANNKAFKLTGVPTYGNESSVMVYLTVNGDNTLTIKNPRTAQTLTGSYTMSDILQVTNWTIEDPTHPLEGPYIQTGGSSPLRINAYKVDMSDYIVYEVEMQGDIAGTAELECQTAGVRGVRMIQDGSLLLMSADANAPVRSEFRVHQGNVVVHSVETGELTADGHRQLIIELDQPKTYWTVRLTGTALAPEDRLQYNGFEYANNASIAIPTGQTPDAREVRMNVTDRFVWGPIIDTHYKTIMFEVRDAAADLESGHWYQLQLSPTAEGRYFVPNETGNLVEGVLKMNPRNAGSQIYMIGANKTSGSWTVEFIGKPANEAETYLYINNRSGNTTQVMMQNGYYITDQSQYSSSASNTQFEYNSTTHEFHWRNPVYPWGNLNGMTAAVGKSASADGSIKVIAHKVPVKAYKVAISGGAGTLVYNGEAEIIGNKHAANGYFIFAKEGQMLEGEAGGTIDISKFMLRDIVATINSITATTNNGITTLNVNVSTPAYGKEIIHVQNRYYDYLENDPLKPVNGFIHEGEGWNVRTGTNGEIREQRTSVFEIPIYLKQGTSFTSYMPTNELKSYQRWYDWDSDGLVDHMVLTSLTSWGVSEANTYTNGHLTGDSYGGYRNSPQFTLPIGMEEYNVGLDLARFGTGGTRGNGSLIEPTIGMRVVYQLRDAKQIANAIKTASDGGKFYEVHNISLPNVQYGSRASRLEDRTLSTTLPINMDLNNYWGFNNGGTGDANLVQLTQDSQLRVELVAGGAPIQNVMMIPGSGNAASGNISRTSFNTGHFVLFQYPDNGYIEPNSAATINVYMTSGNVEYKLVQFNLTFIGNAHPLVVTELKNSYRHPDALTTEFGAPVTELTFDQVANWEYSTTEAGVSYPDYRYPLDYAGASYAFGARNGRSWAASRGEYALTSMSGSSTQTGTPRIIYYPVANYLRSMKDPVSALGSKIEGAYQLYIDAADQPGKIASIELNDALCAGSRLYCYGYIGCTSGGTTYHPTSVLINVMGINKDTHEEELIYSYCPGIVTLRGYAEDGRTIYSTSMGSSSSYSQRTGNEDRNYWAPWQQIGFSFAISAEVAAQMEGYSIQIMNNAYNSTGGDTMLDDFQIFVKKPGAEVANTTPLCSDQIRHIKVITEYETLLEATGEDADGDGLMNVGFCFLDKEIYDQALIDYAANINLPRTDAENTYNKAFGLALMGERTLDKTEKDHAFHNFDIPRDGVTPSCVGAPDTTYYYDLIEQYSFKESMDDKVYRDSIRGERYIVFKESVAHGEASGITQHKWTAGKSYYLLFSTATISSEHVNNRDLACTVFNLDDNKCSVLYEFTVAPPVSVKGDAQEIVSGDEVNACEGQVTTLAVNLNGRTETDDVVLKNLNYDWWLGYINTANLPDHEGNDSIDSYGNTVLYNTTPATLNDYLSATYGTYQNDNQHLDKRAGDPIYLSDALLEMRRAYPLVKNLDDVRPTHETGDLQEYELTQDMIDCIRHFLDEGVLILNKKESNLVLSRDKADAQSVMYIVVIPIAPGLYSVNEDVIYCPDPQELKINLTHKAPSIMDGFDGMAYPADMTNVPVRVGLGQIQAVRHEPGISPKHLRVPLRNAQLAYANKAQALTKDGDVAYFYMVGSDDPHYRQVYQGPQTGTGNHLIPSDEDFDEMAIEAGTIEYLSVEKNGGSFDNSFVDLTFHPAFHIREGYTYTFKLYFIEVMPGGIQDEACPGAFVFDMKVVPEYQRWTGTVNSDWTNDKNWKRADVAELYADQANADDLNQSIGSPLHQYITNEENTTDNSFVPMYFTNVLIDSLAKHMPGLYATHAGANGFTELAATATNDIEYDMLVRPDSSLNSQNQMEANGHYTCELYHTYTAKGLTFEPGTQMYNAHLLNYERAWVEYLLEARQWHTLSSPLQGMIAGDWYAPTATSSQLTPHFTPITYDEQHYDRWAPAFYQKTWDAGTANIYRFHGDDGLVGDASIVNVATRLDWSKVYNDVQVDYSTEGFAVKPVPADPAVEKVLVRLPKDDAYYYYYTHDYTQENNNRGDQTSVQTLRPNAHRLHSDRLTMGSFTLTYANVDTANHYFLVSNPLMTSLDMQAFFNGNANTIEPMYWLIEGNRHVANLQTTDGGWITNVDNTEVSPGQSFFVKGRRNGSSSVSLIFTADMQVDPNAPTPAEPKPSLLYVKANDDEGVLALGDGENLQSVAALMDSQTDGDAACVYALVDGVAQTISLVPPTIDRIPLCITPSRNQSQTLITFSHSDALIGTWYLYDALHASYDMLSDDMTIEVEGTSVGRYFLTRTAEATDLDDEQSTMCQVCNQIEITAWQHMISVVSSREAILQIMLYDLQGRQIMALTPNTQEVLFEAEEGLYIVDVETETSQKAKTVKLQ